MTTKKFYKLFTVFGSALTLSAGVIAAAFYGVPALAGVVLGGVWAYLNLSFMMRLVETAIGGSQNAAPRSRGILWVATLKFPVLYLTGYFILQSRLYPVYAILAGLTAFFAAFVAAWSVSGFSVKVAGERTS